MSQQTLVPRIGRGLTSLGTLLILAAGVPIALWALAGWPLPAGLPSPSAIAAALSQERIPDSTLIKALALVGWIAWLQVAMSLVVETAAWVTGRPSPRLRLTGPIQPFVRNLVASAALLLGSSNPSQLAYATPLHARPTAVVAALKVEPDRVAANRLGVAAGVPAPAPVPAPTYSTYTVVRRDTLWGLAERHLRDPLRWREIYDLSRGKPQGDGRHLDDPNLIIPGWVLTFPADAIGLPEVGPARPPLRPSPAPTPPAQECKPAPTPTTDAPPSTTTTPPPAAGPTTTVPTAVRPPGAEPAAPRGSTDDGERPIPLPLIGAGLAAASLVAVLARLRRVQQRRRLHGRRPRPPGPHLESVERRLRRAADLESAEFLDLALRAFAAGTRTLREAPPAVLAVRAGGEQVELLLTDPPLQPPKGFQPTSDEHGWITDPDLDADDLRALAIGQAAPLPGLVSLGQLDGDHLLVDLETAGVLTIGGETEAADSAVRSIVMQLATSPWVDHVDVLLVDAASLDVAGAARVRRLPDLEEAVDELAALASSIADALDAAGCSSTLQARCSEKHDDGWIPTVLVCTREIDDSTLERLIDIAGGGNRGVAVVARSSARSTWHAQVTDDELVLSPLGFRLIPGLVDAKTASAVDELLSDAIVGEDEPSDAVADAARDEPPATPRAPYSDPSFEIEVRVLGPVEVAGLETPLDRRKSIELTAYIALHPKGVTDERLKTILWPDELPKDGTFNTNVSMARTRLGRDRDGGLHLPHKVASGNVYRLGPRVTTDLARFEARVAHAKLSPPSDATVALREALELVRGQPFEGARGFEWAYSEGLVAATEATVADAAHALAQLYLDARDPAGAGWAANQGLKASPGDEILYRDRMLACDLAGNPAGVESVMDELCEVVEALEPYDALHPDTLTLYERISHRRRSRSAPD